MFTYYQALFHPLQQEVEQWVARAVVPPTEADITAVNDLVIQLKADGVFHMLDVLCVAVTDEDNSLLNIVQNQYDGTIEPSYVDSNFVPNVGFYIPTTAPLTYINSNFSPVDEELNNPNFNNYDWSMGMYTPNMGLSDAVMFGVEIDSGGLGIAAKVKDSTNGAELLMQNTTSDDWEPYGTYSPKGFYGAVQITMTNSISRGTYRKLVPTDSEGNSWVGGDAAPSLYSGDYATGKTDIYFGAYNQNDSDTANFIGGTISGYWIGAGMNATQSGNMVEAMHDYMVARGIEATVYDDDAEAYFERTDGMSTECKGKINQLVIDLKLSGVWNDLDILCVAGYARDNTDAQNNALQNIKSDNYHSTKMNSPTYINNFGWTITSTGAIDSNFLSGTNFTDNDNYMGVYVNKHAPNAGGVLVGSYQVSARNYYYYSAPTATQFYSQGISAFVTNRSLGLWHAFRTSDTVAKLIAPDSTSVTLPTSTSGAFPAIYDYYVGALNNTGTRSNNATDAQISAYAFGKGDLDYSDLQTAIDTYFETYDDDAQAYFDRTTGMTAASKRAINNLVLDLKESLTWDNLDVLCVASDADTTIHAEDNSLLNIISTSFNATRVNSPSFIENEGWTSTTIGCIDTNFVPTADTYNYDIADNAIGVSNRYRGFTGDRYQMGVKDTIDNYIICDSGIRWWGTSQGEDNTIGTFTAKYGTYIVTRLSTTDAYFLNGAADSEELDVGTYTDTGFSGTYSMYVGGLNNAGTPVYNAGMEFAAWFIGGGYSFVGAQAALRNYFITIGEPLVY